MDCASYDAANRLTNAGAVAYTWNANGNLLNDGVYTYTYDTANRLSTVTGVTLTASYAYNGQGDRMRQVTGGITTTYTLDLNAGLVQVLADSGAITYLYGNGRIAQLAGSNAQYFLADHLGSVRQLTNTSGAVTLAKGYQPYGSVLNSAGTGASSYGFTGEFTDNTGLLYLRARYYAPMQARFTSTDPSRLESNLFRYANGNPLNFTDATGLFPEQLIASSFGYESFNALLNAWWAAELSNGDFRPVPWGWLALLLDANSNDRFRYGSLIIPPLISPFVNWNGIGSFFSDNCTFILANGRPLRRFTGTTPHGQSIETSPYFELIDRSSNLYVTANDFGLTSYPDFYSTDVGLPCIRPPKFPWVGGCVTGSWVVSRFGERYFLVTLSANVSDPRFPGTNTTGGVAYGWIDPNDWMPASPRVKPTDVVVDEVIQGACFSSVLTNVLNGQLALCRTLHYGVRGVIITGGTFSSQSIGAGVSLFTFPMGRDINLQWNSFVEMETTTGWTFAKLATRNWP